MCCLLTSLKWQTTAFIYALCLGSARMKLVKNVWFGLENKFSFLSGHASLQKHYYVTVVVESYERGDSYNVVK